MHIFIENLLSSILFHHGSAIIPSSLLNSFFTQIFLIIQFPLYSHHMHLWTPCVWENCTYLQLIPIDTHFTFNSNYHTSYLPTPLQPSTRVTHHNELLPCIYFPICSFKFSLESIPDLFITAWNMYVYNFKQLPLGVCN